jgi:hypothetical protein
MPNPPNPIAAVPKPADKKENVDFISQFPDAEISLNNKRFGDICSVKNHDKKRSAALVKNLKLRPAALVKKSKAALVQ